MSQFSTAVGQDSQGTLANLVTQRRANTQQSEQAALDRLLQDDLAGRQEAIALEEIELRRQNLALERLTADRNFELAQEQQDQQVLLSRQELQLRQDQLAIEQQRIEAQKQAQADALAEAEKDRRAQAASEDKRIDVERELLEREAEINAEASAADFERQRAFQKERDDRELQVERAKQNAIVEALRTGQVAQSEIAEINGQLYDTKKQAAVYTETLIKNKQIAATTRAQVLTQFAADEQETAETNAAIRDMIGTDTELTKLVDAGIRAAATSGIQSLGDLVTGNPTQRLRRQLPEIVASNLAATFDGAEVDEAAAAEAIRTFLSYGLSLGIVDDPEVYRREFAGAQAKLAEALNGDPRTANVVLGSLARKIEEVSRSREKDTVFFSSPETKTLVQRLQSLSSLLDPPERDTFSQDALETAIEAAYNDPTPDNIAVVQNFLGNLPPKLAARYKDLTDRFVEQFGSLYVTEQQVRVANNTLGDLQFRLGEVLGGRDARVGVASGEALIGELDALLGE